MVSEDYLRMVGLIFLAALAAAVVDPGLTTLLLVVFAGLVVYPFVHLLARLYLALTNSETPPDRWRTHREVTHIHDAPPRSDDQSSQQDRSRQRGGR